MIVNRGITAALERAENTDLESLACRDGVKLALRFYRAVDNAIGAGGNRADVLDRVKESAPQAFTKIEEIAKLAEFHMQTASSHECPQCMRTQERRRTTIDPVAVSRPAAPFS